MSIILDVNGLSMDFGGVRAMDRLDIDIRNGEIAALIGPNGAGKTTFFNCITGLYRPTAGTIHISPPGKTKKKLNGLKPNKVTEAGLARTFQNIRLFPNMTALENIMIGRHCRLNAGIAGAVFRNPGTVCEEKKLVSDCIDILEKIEMTRYVNELAKNLPYGAQRRLEIGRALATEPFLLLLDEPAAGMNPNETSELNGLINKIRTDEHISILLIEHDMKMVMQLSDRIFVMDYGRKIAEGTPSEIKIDPVVIKAYLGEEFNA